MKYEEQYERFLKEWGFSSQSNMCVEEMSELIKELCKLRRYKDDPQKKVEVVENIKEEIADVLNTVEQMQWYFGKEEIEKIRAQKIAKAEKRLKNKE